MDVPYAVTLGILTALTVFFSMFNTPSIRGWRNLGLLACYLSLPAFFIAGHWKSVLTTWVAFGLLGGIIYTAWEVFQNARAKKDEKEPISFGHIGFALFSWPIMIPEAIEYFLAEFGVLKSPEPVEPDENAEPGGVANSDSAPVVPPSAPSE